MSPFPSLVCSSPLAFICTWAVTVPCCPYPFHRWIGRGRPQVGGLPAVTPPLWHLKPSPQFLTSCTSLPFAADAAAGPAAPSDVGSRKKQRPRSEGLGRAHECRRVHTHTHTQTEISQQLDSYGVSSPPPTAPTNEVSRQTKKTNTSIAETCPFFISFLDFRCSLLQTQFLQFLFPSARSLFPEESSALTATALQFPDEADERSEAQHCMREVKPYFSIFASIKIWFLGFF